MKKLLYILPFLMICKVTGTEFYESGGNIFFEKWRVNGIPVWTEQHRNEIIQSLTDYNASISTSPKVTIVVTTITPSVEDIKSATLKHSTVLSVSTMNVFWLNVSTISGRSPVLFESPLLISEIKSTNNISIIQVSSQISVHTDAIIQISTTVTITGDLKLPKKLTVDEITIKASQSGIGLNNNGRTRSISADVEVSSGTFGFMLEDSGAGKWLVTVSSPSGALLTTKVASSLEIPLSERIRLLAEKEKNERSARANHKAAVSLEQRLNAIEEILGLK